MASASEHEPLRNRIQSIYRANPAGMGIVVDRTLVEVNAKLCEMTGYSKKELMGRSSRILYLSDEEFQRIGAGGSREIETGDRTTQETRWRRKDGSTFDVLISSSPLDLGNLSEGITFTALDITEYKRAEDALRRSEERYRLLFSSISDAVLVHPFHEDGAPEYFVEVNDVACQRLGYTRDELLRMSTQDIDAPEGLAPIPEAMRKLKADGFVQWEGMHVTKDGRKIPVEITNRLFEMEGTRMILATIRDISERRNAEQAFRDHEETLHALLNATTDLAFLVSDRGTLLVWNEAFSRAVGGAGTRTWSAGRYGR